MIEEALRKVGLTQGEIKVYTSLLELGSSSTGKITKTSGISGSKVYEVLDRLIKKGLVSSTTKNNVKHFEAARPEKILDYLEEKKEEIEEEKKEIKNIIPEILEKYSSSPKTESKIYTGWEGMKTATRDLIDTLKKGEEWVSMGLSQQPKSWEIYFNNKQKERAKKGIIHRHLINEKYKDLVEKRKKLAHTEYRFLSEELEMPTSTEIYANKVAIFILVKENPMVIIIENEHVAESYRKYFENVWKTAKKAD
jgi:sugar-specific transcriptional regulator TrmB